MYRFKSRGLLAAAAVAGIVLSSLGVGAVIPAANAQILHAATISPDLPGALNVLPSAVTAGTKVAASSAEALTITLQKYLYDPAFWASVEAEKAGIASAAQKTRLATVAADFAVPAVKPGLLTKVPPGAGLGVAFGGFEVGMLLGNVGSRMMGFKDSQVCEQRNGALTLISSITNGVSVSGCGAWEKASTYTPNQDASAGYTMAPVCTTDGNYCFQLTGETKMMQAPSNQLAVTCTTKTGNQNYTDTQSMSVRYSDGTTSGNNNYAPGAVSYSCASPSWTMWTSHASGVPKVITGLKFYSATTFTPVTIQTANPNRTTKSVIKYADGTSTISPSSDQFTENDPTFNPSPLPPVPATKIPTEIEVWETTEGAPDSLLSRQPTTPEYQKLRQDYPECAAGTCMLDLEKIGVGSCMVNAAACADWFKDPARADTYTCKYAGKVVAFAECNAYSTTFQPAAKENGTTIANPETGESVGQVAPTFQSNPAFDPESGPRNCFPTGWGVFNPLAWVYQPVRCATEWAFVPGKAKMDAANGRINAAVAGSALGSAGAVLGTIGAAGIVAGGCEGIPWAFSVESVGFEVDANILASCPGDPLHDVSVQIRAILVALLWTIAVLAWIRYLATIFGYTGFGSGRTADAPTSVAVNGGVMHQVNGSAGAIGRGNQKSIES